jgi:hypothetical protein
MSGQPGQPGISQPGIAQQGMAQQGLAQHGAAQPGMAQPGAAQPGVAQPGMAQPGAGAQADEQSRASARRRQEKLARQRKKQRRPSPAVLGGGGAFAVLVVLVVVALIAHIGPFSSGHKTVAGPSTRPTVAAGDPPATAPGTAPPTGASSSASRGHGRGSPGRKAKPSSSPSSKPTSSSSPSKTPSKPKHSSGSGSGPLVPYGPSLLVDGDFSQTTLAPWNYVVQNAVIEPGQGEGGSSAVELTSTPAAAVGETVSGLTAGASYELTGWAHTNGTKIYMGIMDPGDNTINDHEMTTSGSWTELSAVYKVPVNEDSATIYCIMDWGGVGYCSDLSFRAMHHS